MKLLWENLAKGVTGGGPRAWAITVTAPQWDITKLAGPVHAQSPHAVVWRIAALSTNAARADAAACSVTLSRHVTTTLPPSTRRQERGELVAAFAIAVCGIGIAAAFTIATFTGPIVPRRWLMTALALTAVTCLVAAVEPHGPSTWVPGLPPGEIWVPGPALGLWLWYVLPVLGWWLSRRLVTRRPPAAGILLVSAASPVLSLVLMVIDWSGPHASGVNKVSLSGFLVLLLAVPLLLATAVHRCAPPASATHRWALTASTLVWTAFSAEQLGVAPPLEPSSEQSALTQTAILLATWPAAAWLTSLLGPVLRRAPGRVVLGTTFLLLWGALVAPYVIDYVTPRPPTPGDETYRQPFFTGYADSPLFVVVLCGVTLQVLYLCTRGAGDGSSHRAEPVSRALMLCAVTMALGNPSLRTLSMWGDALAVLWTALTTMLLIPVGAGTKTTHLRRVSRPMHALLMDRWVTSQLRWDARAEFQRTARSALADDMEVSAFTQRWRALQVPGRGGDPATRLSRARRLALGSAAGLDPRTAGLAGALLAQALALPWAVYKLVTSQTAGTHTLFHLHDWALALRFGHWALYGFVFGYFYPLLRGNAPVGKAWMLLVVIAPAEVLPMITLTIDPQYTHTPSWTDLAVACGGVTGQAFVVCMGFALSWEWWLARAAGLKWSQVRNFRRLSSITVPATTVLVAGATAFATAVAGTWAQHEPRTDTPPSFSQTTDHTAQPSR